MIVQALFPEDSPRVDREAWDRFVARVHAERPGLVMAPVTVVPVAAGWWVVLELGRRQRWVSGRTPEDAAVTLLGRMVS